VDVHVSVEPAPEGMLLEGADGAVPLGLLVPQYHRDFREREREREKEREREREKEADAGRERQRRDGVVIDTALPEWERLPDLVHLRDDASPSSGGGGGDIAGPSKRA